MSARKSGRGKKKEGRRTEGENPSFDVLKKRTVNDKQRGIKKNKIRFEIVFRGKKLKKRRTLPDGVEWLTKGNGH